MSFNLRNTDWWQCTFWTKQQNVMKYLSCNTKVMLLYYSEKPKTLLFLKYSMRVKWENQDENKITFVWNLSNCEKTKIVNLRSCFIWIHYKFFTMIGLHWADNKNWSIFKTAWWRWWKWLFHYLGYYLRYSWIIIFDPCWNSKIQSNMVTSSFVSCLYLWHELLCKISPFIFFSTISSKFHKIPY